MTKPRATITYYLTKEEAIMACADFLLNAGIIAAKEHRNLMRNRAVVSLYMIAMNDDLKVTVPREMLEDED